MNLFEDIELSREDEDRLATAFVGAFSHEFPDFLRERHPDWVSGEAWARGGGRPEIVARATDEDAGAFCRRKVEDFIEEVVTRVEAEVKAAAARNEYLRNGRFRLRPTED